MNEDLFKRNSQNGVRISSNFHESKQTKFTSLYDTSSQNTVIMLNVERATVYEAKEFLEYVNEIIEDGKNRIIVDLENVSFIDSVFFGTLIKLLKKTGKEDGYVKLIVDAQSKPELLSIGNFDGIFQIYSTLFEAVAGLKAS
ncbi:MAG: STAS domain-containing protein [Ignavibacteriae bacterium]|nr:STAS domain-containing protein [Ignavibacteriota bacterium]